MINHKPLVKSRMQINYALGAIAEFGKYVVFWSGNNLLAGYFLNSRKQLNHFVSEVKKRWPSTIISEIKTKRFQSKLKLKPLLKGSKLELKVWETLTKIARGEVWSYEKVAQKAGYPRAIRAVASAIGRNPLSLVIPCHRVIKKDGRMGNYHFGKKLKKLILKTENINLKK